MNNGESKWKLLCFLRCRNFQRRLPPSSRHSRFFHFMLRAWKGKDLSFPFNDSHAQTDSVRDGSDWESTLKPRLCQRLRASKNIILFLNSTKFESKTLKEEIEYGVSNQGLPVIVAYPRSDSLLERGCLKKLKNLWVRLSTFKRFMGGVPTLHVPLQKNLIKISFD